MSSQTLGRLGLREQKEDEYLKCSEQVNYQQSSFKGASRAVGCAEVALGLTMVVHLVKVLGVGSEASDLLDEDGHLVLLDGA